MEASNGDGISIHRSPASGMETGAVRGRQGKDGLEAGTGKTHGKSSKKRKGKTFCVLNLAGSVLRVNKNETPLYPFDREW